VQKRLYRDRRPAHPRPAAQVVGWEHSAPWTFLRSPSTSSGRSALPSAESHEPAASLDQVGGVDLHSGGEGLAEGSGESIADPLAAGDGPDREGAVAAEVGVAIADADEKWGALEVTRTQGLAIVEAEGRQGLLDRWASIA
jgi:hypothetical protein